MSELEELYRERERILALLRSEKERRDNPSSLLFADDRTSEAHTVS